MQEKVRISSFYFQLQYYIDPVDVNFFIRNYEDFSSNSNIIRIT